jgi:hypothetical protein
LPSRVIDVGSNDDDIRLVETRGTTGQYLTLSHCWGKNPVVMTRQENLDLFKNNIALGILSKTFREAIHLTRRLDYRFIWIDSLCIIQDDTDDWNKEAAVMGQIYLRSALTIAATSSADGSGGLFYNRTQSCSVELPYRPVPGPSWGTMCVTSRLGNINNLIVKGPLNDRGWVFQERMLSRRILHCTSGQVFWECQKFGKTEDGEILDLSDPNTAGMVKFQPMLPMERQNWQNWKSPSLHWYRLMEHYTKLQLTRSSDRLPALLGFANEIEKVCKIAYEQGVWMDSLHVGLLWEFEKKGRVSVTDIAPIEQAPTWSWASLLLPILFPDNLLSAEPSLSRVGRRMASSTATSDIQISLPPGSPFDVSDGKHKTQAAAAYSSTLGMAKKFHTLLNQRFGAALDLGSSSRQDHSNSGSMTPLLEDGKDIGSIGEYFAGMSDFEDQLEGITAQLDGVEIGEQSINIDEMSHSAKHMTPFTHRLPQTTIQLPRQSRRYSILAVNYIHPDRSRRRYSTGFVSREWDRYIQEYNLGEQIAQGNMLKEHWENQGLSADFIGDFLEVNYDRPARILSAPTKSEHQKILTSLARQHPPTLAIEAQSRMMIISKQPLSHKEMETNTWGRDFKSIRKTRTDATVHVLFASLSHDGGIGWALLEEDEPLPDFVHCVRISNNKNKVLSNGKRADTCNVLLLAPIWVDKEKVYHRLGKGEVYDEMLFRDTKPQVFRLV